VSLIVTVLLAAVSMLFYYLMTGYVVPDPAQFIVLFLIISQAAYALILKPSAQVLEATAGTRDKDNKHVAL
jgi:Co/Zn/Cd efflux system component